MGCKGSKYSGSSASSRDGSHGNNKKRRSVKDSDEKGPNNNNTLEQQHSLVSLDKLQMSGAYRRMGTREKVRTWQQQGEEAKRRSGSENDPDEATRSDEEESTSSNAKSMDGADATGQGTAPKGKKSKRLLREEESKQKSGDAALDDSGSPLNKSVHSPKETNWQAQAAMWASVTSNAINPAADQLTAPQSQEVVVLQRTAELSVSAVAVRQRPRGGSNSGGESATQLCSPALPLSSQQQQPHQAKFTVVAKVTNASSGVSLVYRKSDHVIGRGSSAVVYLGSVTTTTPPSTNPVNTIATSPIAQIPSSAASTSRKFLIAVKEVLVSPAAVLLEGASGHRHGCGTSSSALKGVQTMDEILCALKREFRMLKSLDACPQVVRVLHISIASDLVPPQGPLSGASSLTQHPPPLGRTSLESPSMDSNSSPSALDTTALLNPPSSMTDIPLYYRPQRARMFLEFVKHGTLVDERKRICNLHRVPPLIAKRDGRGAAAAPEAQTLPAIATADVNTSLPPAEQPPRLHELTARAYMKEVLLGLCYLHEHRVVHRDLKLQNILCHAYCEDLYGTVFPVCLEDTVVTYSMTRRAGSELRDVMLLDGDCDDDDDDDEAIANDDAAADHKNGQRNPNNNAVVGQVTHHGGALDTSPHGRSLAILASSNSPAPAPETLQEQMEQLAVMDERGVLEKGRRRRLSRCEPTADEDSGRESGQIPLVPAQIVIDVPQEACPSYSADFGRGVSAGRTGGGGGGGQGSSGSYQPPPEGGVTRIVSEPRTRSLNECHRDKVKSLIKLTDFGSARWTVPYIPATAGGGGSGSGSWSDELDTTAAFLLRSADAGCKTTLNVVGTAPYMSPEAIRGKFSTASDVWSFAICFLELIQCQDVWHHLQAKDSFQMVLRIGSLVAPNHMPVIPPHLSPECRDMLVRCLSYDPYERPSALELLHSLYFATSEWIVDAKKRGTMEAIWDVRE